MTSDWGSDKDEDSMKACVLSFFFLLLLGKRAAASLLSVSLYIYIPRFSRPFSVCGDAILCLKQWSFVPASGLGRERNSPPAMVCRS